MVVAGLDFDDFPSPLLGVIRLSVTLLFSAAMVPFLFGVERGFEERIDMQLDRDGRGGLGCGDRDAGSKPHPPSSGLAVS